MDGYSISAAARLSGFSVSALRFYEKEGVVVPQRTASRYRSYREDDIAALRFVARAKSLGLSLPEIRELLRLLQDEECRPVQTRLRELVTTHIEEAHQQISELVAFTALLQEVASGLGRHTADGPCDEECGCQVGSPVNHTPARSPVPLLGRAAPEVACSLTPDLVAGRVEDWRDMAAQGVGRDPIPDGVRIRFARDVDAAALARLAAAEQTCCDFFTFSIEVRSDEITLDVTGPADAQPVITAMFGTAA